MAPRKDLRYLAIKKNAEYKREWNAKYGKKTFFVSVSGEAAKRKDA
jgi:hypothetical protein